MYGIATLSFVLLPWVFGSILQFFVAKDEENKGAKKSPWIEYFDKLPNVIKLFPFFQILTNSVLVLKSHDAKIKMEECKQEYKKLSTNIETISKQMITKRKQKIIECADDYQVAEHQYLRTYGQINDLKVHEVFGESAPQSILQISIILRRGKSVFCLQKSSFILACGEKITLHATKMKMFRDHLTIIDSNAWCLIFQEF